MRFPKPTASAFGYFGHMGAHHLPLARVLPWLAVGPLIDLAFLAPLWRQRQDPG